MGNWGTSVTMGAGIGTMQIQAGGGGGDAQVSV